MSMISTCVAECCDLGGDIAVCPGFCITCTPGETFWEYTIGLPLDTGVGDRVKPWRPFCRINSSMLLIRWVVLALI